MVSKALLFISIVMSAILAVLMSARVTLAQINLSWMGTTTIINDSPYNVYLPLTTHELSLSLPSWRVVDSPNSSNLTSVSMLTDNIGFIVGEMGTILEWDGVSWEMASSPTLNNLDSVSIGDQQNGWAVSGLMLFKWDGNSWSQVSGAPALPFQSVSAKDDKAWMVGGFMVCNPECNDVTGFTTQWDGNNWSTIYTFHKYLYAIDMFNELDGFAVGDIFDPANPLPAIIRWNGTSWENQTHPPVQGLGDISILDSNNAWAVGLDANYTCTLLNWNGSAWSTYSCPSGVDYLSAISMVAENDVWAVGGPHFIHWDGISWTSVEVAVPADLNDIEMRSANEGWAVGAGGTIVHFAP